MHRWMLVLAITVTAGCMPAITPSPVKSVSYEFDQDTQQWTQRDCTTKTLDSHEVEIMCYKKTILAPPGGLERTRGL